jgi:hypothetical protein
MEDTLGRLPYHMVMLYGWLGKLAITKGTVLSEYFSAVVATLARFVTMYSSIKISFGSN